VEQKSSLRTKKSGVRISPGAPPYPIGGNANVAVSLFDLIDLKETKNCRVRINGAELDIVHLRIEGDKRYAMIAGGKLVEVSKEIFAILDERLEEHLRKFIFQR
jgi:hypothetical protein